MTNILIIGAGLSASSMIRYFLEHSKNENWKIRVGDMDADLAAKKVGNHPYGEAFRFDAMNPDQRSEEIKKADFVVSMLPAALHVEVVKDCIRFRKNVITPSYVSPEMRLLNDEAKEAGIIVMNEIGVDPGIDHMSAMKIIHHIQKEGGLLERFESYTGGLIAPESDNNPWNYKFTWNPRNVVIAGQGGAARYIENGEYKYIPYHQLFERTSSISVDGYGAFEGYANRDSLSYRTTYGIDNIPTLIRGTFRKSGYCKAWNAFVKLGMTDDSYKLMGSENMTKRAFLNAFLPYSTTLSVEQKFLDVMGWRIEDDAYSRMEWLGMFSEEMITPKGGTPAQLLQAILEPKLKLAEGDKDMIVMFHRFQYRIGNKQKEINSSLVYIGSDQVYTAMSDTVGLPVAICAKLILNGTITAKGVQLPLSPEIYNPILDELANLGVVFKEVEMELV